MKAWLGIIVAVAVLVGAGAVLLHSNQAPIEAASDVPPPAPVPAAPPPAPEPKPLSLEDFRALGAEVMKALPRKDAKPAENLPVVEAGDHLAKINEAVEKDSTFVDEALLLYRECAASGQYSDGVRALCFANFRALAKKSGKKLPSGSVPAYIRNLADQLGQ